MLEIEESPWSKYFVLADEPHYELKELYITDIPVSLQKTGAMNGH